VTHSDLTRLRGLLESALHFLRHDRPYLETLEEELEGAQVVPVEQMPGDVVILNSRVRIRDLSTGEPLLYTLVFPKDASVGKNRLSVLAPIGSAILGRRVGEVVESRVPAGVRYLKLEEVEWVTSTQNPLEWAA
jgi:regulator of nucleoside diphosphate kinase